MPEKPEIVPDDAYIMTVNELAQKLLAKLAVELGHPLQVRTLVCRDRLPIATLGETVVGAGGYAQRGEVHLRFRATGSPSRYLFLIDSVFEPDERTPTFSGYFARGDVKKVESECIADHNSWVVKREDRQWIKWL